VGAAKSYRRDGKPALRDISRSLLSYGYGYGYRDGDGGANLSDRNGIVIICD